MKEEYYFSFRSLRDDRIIIINMKRKINRFSLWGVWKTGNSIYFLRKKKSTQAVS